MGTICALVVCGENGYINRFLTALNKAFPYVVVEHELTDGRYCGKLRFGKDTQPEQVEAFAQRADHEVQVGTCDCTKK